MDSETNHAENYITEMVCHENGEVSDVPDNEIGMKSINHQLFLGCLTLLSLDINVYHTCYLN